MNKNSFLVGAACLLISGTALGQVKLVYDSGRSNNYPTEEAAIAAYSAGCRMHSMAPAASPEPAAASIIEESTGKSTPVNCSTVKTLQEAHSAKKPQDTPPKATMGSSWEVHAQQKDGSWKNVYKDSKQRISTEDDARRLAGIECIRRKSPVKIVETASGKEHVLHCDPETGKISNDDKPAPVVLLTEPEAGERAEIAKKRCLSNSFMQSVLDCGCVENKAKAELLQSKASVNLDAILRKVSNPPTNKECVNRTGAYEYTYNACVPVMKSRHPTDAEPFCACAADATAAGFVKDPTLNLAHYERLRNAAFKQCGIGKLNKRTPAS